MSSKSDKVLWRKGDVPQRYMKDKKDFLKKKRFFTYFFSIALVVATNIAVYTNMRPVNDSGLPNLPAFSCPYQ